MSSNNSNKIMVPNAREAMNKFKMEAANEVGVNLKQGYNGDLTSKQAGSVGGQMVKKRLLSEADQGPGGLSLGGALSVGHEDERPHSRDSFPPTKGMAVRPPYLVEGDIFSGKRKESVWQKRKSKKFFIFLFTISH